MRTGYQDSYDFDNDDDEELTGEAAMEEPDGIDTEPTAAEDWLTSDEAAYVLQVSPELVRDMCEHDAFGRGNAIQRRGGRWLISHRGILFAQDNDLWL